MGVPLRPSDNSISQEVVMVTYAEAQAEYDAAVERWREALHRHDEAGCELAELDMACWSRWMDHFEAQ